MKNVSIGERQFRVTAARRGQEWIAHAERAESGDRFGIECAGETESAAIERLVQWLTWQNEHAAALRDLEQAERAYHRTIAGSAFASPVEGPTAIELRKESLDQLEAARMRLDEVRGRKPG